MCSALCLLDLHHNPVCQFLWCFRSSIERIPELSSNPWPENTVKGSPETFFSIYFIIIFTVNITNCTTNLQHFMGANMSLEVARIPDFSYQFTIPVSLDCKINIEIYERINLCLSFFFSALSNNWCTFQNESR